ncbi:MAG: SdpI family protein [Gammaproteobacteria bacterium]|nr:SdpI family protein [Gammaproteobacteria bacterium]
MPRNYRIVSILFLLLAIGIGAFNYGNLPAEIPSHWNAAGEVDDTMPRFWGTAFMPMMMLGMILMFELIIWLSPAGFRLDQFKDVVGIVLLLTLGFLLTVYIAQIMIALGMAISMDRVVMIGIGILFIVLGNFFGKMRKNFFIGIRTPWTLASDEVWARTHRFGGWVFVLAGIAILVGGPLGAPMQFMIGAAVAVGVLPTLYSLILYKRLEGFKEESDPDDEL